MGIYIYIHFVPHHIWSCMALYWDFWIKNRICFMILARVNTESILKVHFARNYEENIRISLKSVM